MHHIDTEGIYSVKLRLELLKNTYIEQIHHTQQVIQLPIFYL